MARSTRNIIIGWGEVKEKMRSVVERGEHWTSQPSGRRLMPLYNSPTEKEVWDTHSEYEKDENGNPIKYQDSFGKWKFRMKEVPEYLASGADISYWFVNGFRSEEFENLAERVPAALQSRPSWSDEEGDIDLGRMAGGWDDFYLGIQERPTKPGVRMQIEMSFASGVQQKTIEQYGAWVNSLLGSMEAYGIDMVIDIWVPVRNVFMDDRGIDQTNFLLRVKNANEVSDFTEWSILFSPAGFRQVMFTAMCVAGDKIGKRVNGSYGNVIGGRTWDLKYDPEESVVRITANPLAGGHEAIPFEALTKKAIEAKLIPDPEKIEA